MSESKRGPGNPNWQKGTSGNPKGRPTEAAAEALRNDTALREMHSMWIEQAYRNDGWYSLLTGLGTTSRDKRLCTRFYADVITYEEGRELWRGDDLGARIVEAIVDEALREQIKFCVPYDAEGNDKEYGDKLTKKVYAFWKSIGLVAALHEAWCYERALGGSAILLGVDDGAQKLTDPMGKARAFNWLTVLEPQEVSPIQWYTDPLAPKFGQVECYRLTPISVGAPKEGMRLTSMVDVHESRLIIFGGIKVSRLPMPGTFNGWGDSVFTRVYRILRDFNTGVAGSAILMNEFGAPVFKMKGLADILKRNAKEDFLARMQALTMAMSTARCALIDMDEEYTRQATPVTGLPELLDFHSKRVAAAAKTPMPILWGESPGGIQVSGPGGSDQLQLWHAGIANDQTKKLEPPIRRITDLGLETMGGAPDEYTIEFEPLHQETKKEKADTEKIVVETVCALFDRGLLSDTEIRRNPDYAQRWGVNIEETPDTLEPGAAEEAAMLGKPVNPNAPVDPNAPAQTGTPGVVGNGQDLQKEAFNGAQVSALIEVVTAVAAGTISRQSAQKMLELAFQLDPAESLALIGPEDFKPTPPEPPAGGPSPFGGGAKPTEPAPKEAPPVEPPAKTDATRADYIEKHGEKWYVYSKSGEVLGEHMTEAEARKQLAAVEASKHARR